MNELKGLDDHILMERLGRGDREAMEELYHRHPAGVFRVPLRLTRRSADADDITQEVFGRSVAHGSATLSTWASTGRPNAACPARMTPVPVESSYPIRYSNRVRKRLTGWRSVGFPILRLIGHPRAGLRWEGQGKTGVPPPQDQENDAREAGKAPGKEHQEGDQTFGQE